MPNLKPKLNSEPQNKHPTIHTFIQAVNNNIEGILEHKQTLPEITSQKL